MEILSCRREDEHDSADIWFAKDVVILYKILSSEDAHLTENKVENRQKKMLELFFCKSTSRTRLTKS